MTVGSAALVLAVLLAAVCTYEKENLGLNPGILPNDVGLAFDRALLDRGRDSMNVAVVVEAKPTATGCNPAYVTATFTLGDGIRRRQRARLRKSTQFALGVSGREVRDVRINLARSDQGGAGLVPVGAAAPGGAVLDVPTGRPAQALTKTYEFTVRQWAKSRVPLVVRFRANWTTFRSVGSCLVRLPSLTSGVASSIAAQSASDPTLTSVSAAGAHISGTVFFGPDSGALDLERSTPKPMSPYLFGLDQWSCSNEPVATVTERETPITCEGSVVRRSLEWQAARSLGLFVLGVLAALSAQLLYDALMVAHHGNHWTRRRLMGVVSLAAYMCLIVWLIPEDPANHIPLPFYLLLWVASTAVGLFVRSRWSMAVPFLALVLYVPYSLWLSPSAKAGFGPDPVLTTQVYGLLAVVLTLTVFGGRMLRQRHTRVAGARPTRSPG